MELKHDIADKPNAKNIILKNGQISFRDVRFSYHTDSSEILKSVSFEIEPNSKVALVGESGEGKSTIANLIARFYEADSGEILVENQNIKDVTQSSLRSQIGIVFQDPSLFSGTIEENIVYGLGRRHTMKDVEHVAKLANAAGFINKLDKGYKTQVGERGIKLSGGQKQRIIIARALLKNPPILILDEATSSLDAKAEAQVQQALSRLMRGRTTIIIAHRLSTISHVDQIIGLRGGKVVEQGSPSELAHKTGGIYAELLKLQTASADTARKRLKKFDIAG
jgi:ATP-binding cassette subfamily B protein